MEREIFEEMLKEFDWINKRTVKLRDFILNKEKFDKVDTLNKDLLIAQLKTMESYVSVLSIRIGLNAPKDETISEEDQNPKE